MSGKINFVAKLKSEAFRLRSLIIKQGNTGCM